MIRILLMYGKILHGSAFGGLVNYVNDPRKHATLVSASDGINISNNQTITDSFIMHSGLSRRTRKPVGHFVLAFSPKDSAHINEKMLNCIVHEYLMKMGYTDNQFVAYRHYDKEHPHVHIVVNRVNFHGKCTCDSHEKSRNIKACKELTEEHGLYRAKGKDNVKKKHLRSMDAIRYQMMHGVSESLRVATNWKEFHDDLANVGIRCHFRYNMNTNGIEGVSFSIAKEYISERMKHDISFRGKQLDASLTLNTLCHKLGNPISVIREQARDIYEDVRKDWCDSHNIYESRYVDKCFPDFELQFQSQINAQSFGVPDMLGDGKPLPYSYFSELSKNIEDVINIGNGVLHVGLVAMADILFQPYIPYVSQGGNDFSSKLGWGDDDKYKKKRRSHVHGFGTGKR